MQYYDQPTRWLHKGMAVTVTAQLLLSLGMEHPKPGVVREPFELQLFEIHEWVGLAAAFLVLAHVVWTLVSHGNASWRSLFLWLTASGRKAIGDELSQLGNWLRQGLPSPDEAHALASMVHGLGLLVVLAMGASGTVLFFGMAEDGSMSPWVHDFKEIHEVVSKLVWAYMIVHLSAAFWHQRLGHDVFARIR